MKKRFNATFHRLDDNNMIYLRIDISAADWSEMRSLQAEKVINAAVLEYDPEELKRTRLEGNMRDLETKITNYKCEIEKVELEIAKRKAELSDIQAREERLRG